MLAGGGNRAFVHHNLGIVLQQRGRHAEALVEFRAAIALDPAFGPAHLLAGSSLLALGRTSDAIASLQQAIRLMPSEPSAHLQLAAAYEQAGNAVGMVDEYRRLTALEPANNEWVFRLGKAYLKLAQWSVRAPGSGSAARVLGSHKPWPSSTSTKAGAIWRRAHSKRRHAAIPPFPRSI